MLLNEIIILIVTKWTPLTKYVLTLYEGNDEISVMLCNQCKHFGDNRPRSLEFNNE